MGYTVNSGKISYFGAFDVLDVLASFIRQSQVRLHTAESVEAQDQGPSQWEVSRKITSQETPADVTYTVASVMRKMGSNRVENVERAVVSGATFEFCVTPWLLRCYRLSPLSLCSCHGLFAGRRLGHSFHIGDTSWGCSPFYSNPTRPQWHLVVSHSHGTSSSSTEFRALVHAWRLEACCLCTRVPHSARPKSPDWIFCCSHGLPPTTSSLTTSTRSQPSTENTRHTLRYRHTVLDHIETCSISCETGRSTFLPSLGSTLTFRDSLTVARPKAQKKIAVADRVGRKLHQSNIAVLLRAERNC